MSDNSLITKAINSVKEAAKKSIKETAKKVSEIQKELKKKIG